MRVAFIVRQFPTLSETFVLNQITGLIDRGHEVDIYADGPKDDPAIHPDVEKYNLLARTHYLPLMPRNLILRVLKAIGLFLLNFWQEPVVILDSLNVFKHGQQAACLRLFYSAIRFQNKPTYDIIHCQFGTLGLVGMWLRQVGKLKGKLVTTFRGIDISWYLEKYGDRVYDQLLREGDIFFANCDYFKRRVIELGGDEKKIHVHYSGINCSRFAFNPPLPPVDGQVRIVTIGRLVEKKGVEYGIRAIAKLAKTYKNIKYDVIGDGPLKQQLQQLIQDLEVTENVNLLSWKTQQEIIDILNNSHILMAPSVTSEEGDREGPVNTLKESMAIGLPVIGTWQGGIPELVEDTISGFLVPERDVDALKEKLGYLIEHPEIWSVMAKAGRSRVENYFDINKLNDELVEVYSQLIANSSKLTCKC